MYILMLSVFFMVAKMANLSTVAIILIVIMSLISRLVITIKQ